jgi:predicted protein tyrosine phosphatase
MKKVYCYSKREFDDLCMSSGWTGNNVPKDKAFISICSTNDVKSTILREPEPHYFQFNTDNILNLDFDDISTPFEFLDESGIRIAEGISMAQALKIVRFISNNIPSRDIIVHCRAGQSRSQAVVSYILWMYGRKYNIEFRPDNPPITPNQFVLGMLKKAAKTLHMDIRMNFEEDGYTVKGITETSVNNEVTLIKVYLEKPEVDLYDVEIVYDVEEGIWSWESCGDRYCYDDWDFRDKFNEFVEKRGRP